MTDPRRPSAPKTVSELAAELVATQVQLQRLRAENGNLRQQAESLATANAHAAELMVQLEEAREAVEVQNEQLCEQTKSLATANAHAAELMVELHEAQELLKEQNHQLELHNRFIRKTFGRYLTNEVVASLLDSPTGLELGGERRKVTLLMSDLRGFTSLSEHLQPEQVVTILNRHLSTMVDVILQYHGTIDEFIGDAIFVIFGAPIQRQDDAQRAVSCAIAMQLAMASVNEQNTHDGLPTVEMGIGIHTGEVVVGNIGSEKRAKYGVVGRHVNLTARIESCTVGSQILISEATRREAGVPLTIAKQIEMTAKGIDTPVTLYEVEGIGAPYNLTLPPKADRLTRLPLAVPIRYTVLETKHLESTMYMGSLIRLSTHKGEINAAQFLPLLSDIKIRLLDSRARELPGYLYAKVTGHASPDLTCFSVHFTFMAPEIVPVLQRLLAADSNVVR
jgi:adenylate cyclase